MEADIKMEQITKELASINTRVHDLEKYAAVTNEKLGHISKSVDGMSDALVKVLWVFGGSVIAAAAGWILNGGLTMVIK